MKVEFKEAVKFGAGFAVGSFFAGLAMQALAIGLHYALASFLQ